MPNVVNYRRRRTRIDWPFIRLSGLAAALTFTTILAWPKLSQLKLPTYYSRCSYAPHALKRGEPGYRPALDADGDGTACEWSSPPPKRL
jgi:hypothetical protein